MNLDAEQLKLSVAGARPARCGGARAHRSGRAAAGVLENACTCQAACTLADPAVGSSRDSRPDARAGQGPAWVRLVVLGHTNHVRVGACQWWRRSLSGLGAWSPRIGRESLCLPRAGFEPRSSRSEDGLPGPAAFGGHAARAGARSWRALTAGDSDVFGCDSDQIRKVAEASAWWRRSVSGLGAWSSRIGRESLC
jgi:hypothetical protein